MQQDGYQKYMSIRSQQATKYNRFLQRQNEFHSIREYDRFTERYQQLTDSVVVGHEKDQVVRQTAHLDLEHRSVTDVIDIVPPQIEDEKPIAEWRLKMLNALSNLYYNGFLELVNFIFTFYIIFTGKQIVWDEEELTFETIAAAILQFVFFVDMVLNLVVLGCENLRHMRASLKLEVALQALGIALLLLDINSDAVIEEEIYDFGQVFLYRNFRITKYYRIIKDV